MKPNISNSVLTIAILIVLACLAVGSARAVDTCLQLVGSIDSHYGIRMKINIKDSNVTGNYSYFGKKASLRLSGNIDNSGKLILKEFDPQGRNTAVFAGNLIQGKRISGIWKDVSPASKVEPRSLPFFLVLEGDDKALGDGTDGIIMVQHTTKLPKPKDTPSLTQVAIINYPEAMPECLSDKSILQRLKRSLSPKMTLGQSITSMAADLNNHNAWLNQVDYQVHYNKNHLVNIEMIESGCGAYPSGFSKYALISTKDGNVLSPKDLFLASSLQILKAKIHKTLEENSKKQIKDLAGDGEPDDKNAIEENVDRGFQYTPVDLSQFKVSDKGITFTYDWGFPHAILALQPSGDCFFSFAELKPHIRKDGPLAQFLH